MYQPKLKDRHIRRLYFLAKRQGKKMTHVLNKIVEEALASEPEPPPYESRRIRQQSNPDRDERKLRALRKFMRDYHRGEDGEDIHGKAYQGNYNDSGDHSPIEHQNQETEATAHPISLGNQG